MRFKFRSALLALVAVSALGISVATSASAHEFVASKTGTLTDTIAQPAEFNPGEFFENFKCQGGTAPSGTGTISELKRKTLIVKATYPDCSVPNWPGSHVATFTMEWEVSAEGKVSLLKLVKLETPVGPVCKWNVVPSAAETSTATFTNSVPVKTIKVVRASEKMKWEYVGGAGTCIPLAESGTWNETFTLGVEGGTLQWK